MASMTDISSNRLAEVRKARGVTQQELADKLGVHFVTISKLERGKMKLTADWIVRLADALGVAAYEIFAPPLLIERLEMEGALKGGLVVQPVSGAAARYRIEMEDADDEASFWVGLADSTFAPFFFQGDVLRFTIFHEDSFIDTIGRLGCVTLSDGRILVAIVDAYHGESRFDLRSTTGQVFHDVAVTQLAVLTGAKIREISYVQKKLAETA